MNPASAKDETQSVDRFYSHECGRIRVIIEPPGPRLRTLEWEQLIEPHVWADYLRPLPRERELPFYPLAAEQARDLIQKRRLASEEFARLIAKGIRTALTKQDPQFGYSPEEWEKITNPTR